MKNWTSYLKFFVRYCSLKNPAFWFVFRFLDHNSRTRFLQTCCFCKKSKKHCKKSYLNGQENLTLGLFKPSKPSRSEVFFHKLGSNFSYFMIRNFMGKENRKNWWSGDLALQTNGKTDKAKLIGHTC